MNAVCPLLSRFKDLQDPRIDRTKRHSLESILMMAICAVICGADSWASIELFAKSKLSFFKKFLNLPHGVPSHDTFGRVFAALDTEAFAKSFTAWVQDLASGVDANIVAIDGKTMRRTLDKANEKAAIHLVSAFAQANQLVLGQVKVDDKSNEIKAIPKLLEQLSLSGALVTLDAMGCQKTIANQIIESDADYLLRLKGNHDTAFEEVKLAFNYAQTNGGLTLVSDEIDAGHGRIEVRTVHALPVDWFADRGAWRGLNSFVQVTAQRHVGDKVSTESRYYLSSLPVEAAQRAAEASRKHWSIENQLHWCLDIAFNEDQQRMRTGNAAPNMALLN